MADTNFDYPPTQTYRLGAALEQAEKRVADLEADADPDDYDRTLNEAENQRDALQWAVDEFGDDAELELQAYTAHTRAQVLDTLRNDVFGNPGEEETTVWLIAAGIAAAPWLDDHDIGSKATVTGQLPPALLDWIETEIDDLNDLSEGN